MHVTSYGSCLGKSPVYAWNYHIENPASEQVRRVQQNCRETFVLEEDKKQDQKPRSVHLITVEKAQWLNTMWLSIQASKGRLRCTNGAKCPIDATCTGQYRRSDRSIHN